MATINLGRIKPVWQGTWNSSTQYIADDIVSYNNASWIARTTSTNSAPADANDDWDKMAEGFTIDNDTVVNAINAGGIDNTKLANNSLTINGTTIALGGTDEITAGKVIQSVALVNTTRQSGVSGSAGTKINFGSFTKQRSDTSLMCHLTVCYEQTVDSDVVNVELAWNGVASNYGFSYVDHENTEGMSVLVMNTVLRGAAAGTADFKYNYPNDIGSGIGTVINPNSTDDSRVPNGTGSVVIIYEVLEG